MIDLYEELTGIIAALNVAGLEYALCGGTALAVHGVPRATVDIDMLMPTNALAPAGQLLGKRGYHAAGADMSFAGGAIVISRLTRRDPESEDFLTVDLLHVTPSLREIWDGRQTTRWEGGVLVTVSRSGLMALKRMRGSAQDRADIERLEGL